MTTLSGTGTVMTFDPKSGAVCSLQHAGFEYINATDKGRLLQTAYSYDNQGEANNPTEGVGKFLSVTSDAPATIGGPGYTIMTQMGYWQTYNGQTLAPDTLTKNIRADWREIKGSFRHQVTVNIASPHQTVTIEGLTGYVNIALSSLYSWTANKLKQLPYTAGVVFNQSLVVHSDDPLLMATPDGSQCIAVYSPMRGYWAWMGAGDNCNKWDAAEHSIMPVNTGNYSWNVFYLVGSLAHVMARLPILICAAQTTGIVA